MNLVHKFQFILGFLKLTKIYLLYSPPNIWFNVQYIDIYRMFYPKQTFIIHFTWQNWSGLCKFVFPGTDLVFDSVDVRIHI